MAYYRQVNEPSPLYIQRTEAERHLGLLREEVNTILPRVGEQFYFETTALQGVIADLKCKAFPDQYALRDLGANAPLVPLLGDNRTNIRYWLSLYQNWQEDPRPNSRKLIYYTTGITVFFGLAESLDKMQL